MYVPAGFLPQVNPQLPELVLWLSSHIHDEARHIEVFTKRSLAGGFRGYALASTELSLQTLLDEHDFSASSLLLDRSSAKARSLISCGSSTTTLRMLRPPPRRGWLTATSAAMSTWDLAYSPDDAHDPVVATPSWRRRRLGPRSSSAFPACPQSLVEALTVMAAPSLQPAEISEAATAVKASTATMERNRLRRLAAAGLDRVTSRHLSDLHTPNLM